MAFLKFLLMYGLFVAMITFSTNEDSRFGINISENYHLPDYIEPIRYTITLVPFYRSFILEENVKDDLNTILFDGFMNASIHIKRTTQYIGLHFPEHINVTVMRLVQIVHEKDNIEKIYNCNFFTYNYSTNVYVVYLQDQVPQGYYNLHIEYKIDAHNNEGFFATSYTNKEGENKEWLLATQFQPIGARQIFPCWDEPRFRTTFEISIIHETNFTILSNNLPYQTEVIDVTNTANPFYETVAINVDNKSTPNLFYQTEVTDVKNIKSITYINSSSELPTHLVAFAMINFPRHFGSDTFGMYCRDDIKQHVTFAWNVAKKVTDYLKNEWKLLKAVNHVLIPRFPDDGISNLELIYYKETAVIYDEKLDTFAHKMKVADLVARLTVNQWFGNIVIPFSWSHLWLVKSLATLLAIDTINETEIFQNNEIKYLFIEQIQYESLHFDLLQYNTLDEDFINFNVLYSNVESPADLKSHFSLPYYRGICVLRMLQHIITDKIFRISINTYLHTYGHIPVTSNNFWSNLYTAINFKYPAFYINNLNNIMDGWVKLQCSPVVKVTRNAEGNSVLINAESANFVCSPLDVWIPITYTTKTELNFTKTSLQDIIWIKNEPTEIHAKEDDWIILNLQQTGNYRVNYDYDIWMSIAHYMYSDSYKNVHILNRAKLIDDAFHFVITQQILSTIFWEIADFLRQETNYIVWYPMFKAMEYMSKVFPYSDLKVVAIKKRLTLLLEPLFDKIIPITNPNNLTECLWRESIKWICIFNDYFCEGNLDILQKNELLKSDSDQWMYYCLKLKVAYTSELWLMILQGDIANSVSQVLESLACSENTALITSLLLRMRLEGDIQISEQTRVKMFFSVVRRHAEKHQVLDFLLSNFTLVIPRSVDKTVSLIYLINNLYSQKNLNKVENFMEQHTERLRINVKQKIKSRLRDIEKHKNYVNTITLYNNSSL